MSSIDPLTGYVNADDFPPEVDMRPPDGADWALRMSTDPNMAVLYRRGDGPNWMRKAFFVCTLRFEPEHLMDLSQTVERWVNYHTS
jgi:hypothetical protein